MIDDFGTGGRPPARIRKGRRTALRLAAALVLVAVAAALAIIRFAARPAPRPEPGGPAAQPSPSEPASPQPVTTDIIIRRGETLSDILGARGVPAQDIDRLKDEVKRQTVPPVNLGRIIAGRKMRLVSAADGRLLQIEYPLDDEEFLLVTREGADIRAVRKKIPYETRIAAVWGTVEDNVVGIFAQKGETDEIAIEMTDLFAWDIDFNTELRVGDAFRMVFEKKYLEGRFVQYGNILAAEFACQGQLFRAFRFVYPDTKKADHFDAGGKSVRKEFLRSPIPYGARITSGFTSRRLHPIYKIYGAHYGVDFGAPLGTPVQATADGLVDFAGANGASGRMIRIKHRNSYETMYLHLDRIFVKPGERVSGGKVIGTVGSTGDSTGPHLDYRIRQAGSYVNPRSWKFQPAEPLRPAFKEAFAAEVRRLSLMLEVPEIVRRAASR